MTCIRTIGVQIAVEKDGGGVSLRAEAKSGDNAEEGDFEHLVSFSVKER